ncbi:MAG: hypothetical protein GY845_06915 [Planctomycetes bacterium]|nr:hypothetical protein [Planctomycetota bacterium]
MDMMRIENTTLAHFSHFSHFSSLYTCRELSTNHPLFEKTNPISEMANDASSVYTRDYKGKCQFRPRKNKPNFKPNKANLWKEQKMNPYAWIWSLK